MFGFYRVGLTGQSLDVFKFGSAFEEKRSWLEDVLPRDQIIKERLNLRKTSFELLFFDFFPTFFVFFWEKT